MYITTTHLYIRVLSSIYEMIAPSVFISWSVQSLSRVHHQLRELTQTRVLRVSDAIQPSHPLSPSSLPVLSVFQHQSLSKWVTLHQVVKVLELQHHPSNEYSGLISFRINCFDLLTVQELSRVFSNTTIQKHQFFSVQLSLWSSHHIHTWLLEIP